MKRIEYKRNDQNLKKDFVRAGKLLQKFNLADYENEQLKTKILTELFGTVGNGISVEHNFHCDLGYNIHVGKNFYAGFNCTILDMAEVKIGDNCLIAPNVGIYTAGHNINPIDRHKTGFAKPTTIGNNVWIGGHCVIIGGVKIGDNSIIASGSVVTKDVPKNTIFAGNPAKKLKDIEAD
ncbi:sugar O-acetyltransferase [Aestuariibaculum marinum]|uniref:Acetyltransferase n=1 Tax=Aestuariibaculum marinum TaxID=2683592 RepID=A0A8J6PPB7_9FLAO|nr:sugar O-acetyltransferase [Aestuariibaculum marinum]MBD0822710.1 sugar O-acetyltransferase [Aestuariibaculum marinum]